MTAEQMRAIQAGNVLRTDFRASSDDWVNTYLGSGRCGGSFNRMGVMDDPRTPPSSFGPTTLMHADHWHHGNLGIDFHLPLARIVFSHPLPSPTSFKQELDLVTGTLTTEYGSEGCRYVLRSAFHPSHPDLLCLEFSEIAGQLPPLRVIPEDEVTTTYGDTLEATVSRVRNGFSVQTGTASSVVLARAFHSSQDIETDARAVVEVTPATTRLGLVLAMGSSERQEELRGELQSFGSTEAYFEDATKAWAERWRDSFVDTGDEELQRHWARSVFWILSSFAPDARCPAPAMGWSGNGWQFNFPQDLSYVSPALLTLGHSDIVRSWVEFYAGCIKFTREFTQRIYGVPGTLWAWEHPIGCEGRLLDGVPHGTPNWFQHEIHNAAYPAQMAYETAVRLGDRKWTRDVAWPVIHGSAEFFAHATVEEADGTFSVDVRPSMGQNEFEEPNRRNYLCSLFAAASTLRRALTVARDLGISNRETELWSTNLSGGLAFSRLGNGDTGVFATAESEDTRVQFGTQKHPIQLDPLFSLPLGEREWEAVREPTLAAYAHQEQLCRQADGKLYDGWTLPALALSAARTGDGDRAIARIRQLNGASLTDSEQTQIYESSLPLFTSEDRRAKCYYTTNAGIVLTTLHSLVKDEFAPYTRHDKPLPVARNWDSRFGRSLE